MASTGGRTLCSGLRQFLVDGWYCANGGRSPSANPQACLTPEFQPGVDQNESAARSTACSGQAQFRNGHEYAATGVRYACLALHCCCRSTDSCAIVESYLSLATGTGLNPGRTATGRRPRKGSNAGSGARSNSSRGPGSADDDTRTRVRPRPMRTRSPTRRRRHRYQSRSIPPICCDRYCRIESGRCGDTPRG